MPHRNNLLQLIENYTPQSPFDEAMKFQAHTFIQNFENCFEREHMAGHATGSAVVVNPERTHVLLMHHKKLGIWIQFGGHCDGDNDVLHVATRELEEESGISDAKLVSANLFDITVPYVPQYKHIPAHVHYDFRFLYEAPLDVNISKQIEEVNDIQWFPLEEAKDMAEFYVLQSLNKI